MKILITAGNNAKTLKLLKEFKSDYVILADYGDVPQMKTDAYTFITLGEINKESTAHILLNHCLNFDVEAIMPINDFEVEALQKSKVLFEEFGIKVLKFNS